MCLCIFKASSSPGGEDYVTMEKNLTFAVGLGTVECVDIPILNDDCLEDMSEMFSVSISSAVECVRVEPAASSVEVTINDDDSEYDSVASY